MLHKQQKQFNWKVKVLDEANRIIEMVGSTEDNDRVGDKMFMAGANLQNYLKNPVILANHNYGCGEKPTVIGRALNVNIQGSQMVFKIQFAETDNGKEWFYLYANKYMNASSIGFIPLKYEPNDQGGYDFTEWELLELSLVAVPCNPNAIQRAYADGKISKALFNAIKKGGNKKMEKEKLEKMVNDLVSKKVKSVLEKKDAEIKALKKRLAGTKVKAGSTLSQDTVDSLVEIAGNIHSAAKSLEEFVEEATGREIPDDDPETSDDTVTCSQCGTINPVENSYCSKCGTQLESENDDTEKEYTDEEISKMIEENVQKTIDAYSSK